MHEHIQQCVAMVGDIAQAMGQQFAVKLVAQWAHSQLLTVRLGTSAQHQVAMSITNFQGALHATLLRKHHPLYSAHVQTPTQLPENMVMVGLHQVASSAPLLAMRTSLTMV